VSNYVLYDSKVDSPTFVSDDASLPGHDMLKTYENEHVAMLEERIMQKD
jgi:hypothetical protein